MTDVPRFYFAARAVCHANAASIFGDKTDKQKKACADYVEKNWAEMLNTINAEYDSWVERQRLAGATIINY